MKCLLLSTFVLLVSADVLLSQPPVTSEASSLVYPIAITTDGKTRYVVDLDLPGVWSINEQGTQKVVVEGSKKFREPLNRPRSIAMAPDGRLLVGDTPTREVFLVDPAGGEPKPITSGGIGIAMSIAVVSDTLAYVADLETQSILKLNLTDGSTETFAKVSARGLHLASDGTLWVVSQGEDQLLSFNEQGEQTVVVGGRPFRFPHNVVVDASGTAYVSDGFSRAIWRVIDGKAEKWLEGEPLLQPNGLAIEEGTLLVVDSKARAVLSVSLESKEIKPLVGPVAP